MGLMKCKILLPKLYNTFYPEKKHLHPPPPPRLSLSPTLSKTPPPCSYLHAINVREGYKNMYNNQNDIFDVGIAKNFFFVKCQLFFHNFWVKGFYQSATEICMHIENATVPLRRQKHAVLVYASLTNYTLLET